MKSKSLRYSKAIQNTSPASAVLIILGVFIIMAALIYMIGNLYRADSFISIWLPFMLSGVVLCFWGLLINWLFPKAKSN